MLIQDSATEASCAFGEHSSNEIYFAFSLEDVCGGYSKICFTLVKSIFSQSCHCYNATPPDPFPTPFYNCTIACEIANQSDSACLLFSAILSLRSPESDFCLQRCVNLISIANASPRVGVTFSGYKLPACLSWQTATLLHLRVAGAFYDAQRQANCERDTLR